MDAVNVELIMQMVCLGINGWAIFWINNNGDIYANGSITENKDDLKIPTLFEYFKEKGIFNPEVAKAFKDNILSMGGSEDPMDLYKKFRGKEPTPEALLKRGGLVK